MKRILSVFLALIAVLTLVACGEKDPEPRTYMADGKYTAYTTGLNYGNPQITWVTVTIENDEIKSFYIDQLQSNAPGEWKTQTKKELGFKYGMHCYTVGNGAYSGGVNDSNVDAYAADIKAAGKLEWHEQAALIETHFLTTLDVTTDGAGIIQGITGVTIADNDYIALAKQAVENAKAGIVNTFKADVYEGFAILTSAQAKVNAEGKITEVKIDELQSGVAEDTFSWNTQTKQQLGYKYGMHQYDLGIYANLKDDANAEALEQYKAAVAENGKLEWFQQVDALAAAWLGGANVSNIASVSGVTISDTGYSAVLAALLTEGWTR